MPLDYSSISVPPTCPANPGNSAPFYENLVFWTLGYGGWTGIALLPIVWSLSVSKSVRAILSILLIPTTALVVTASFGGFYLFANFVHAITSVMISAQFIHSSLAIVCVGLGSVGLFLAGTKRLEIQMVVETEVGSQVDETTSEPVSSDEESDGSHTSADDESTEEGSTEEDASSEGSTDDTWRETANVEGLREAPPLSE